MEELSLNILDIARNSVNAQAKRISIFVTEDENGILSVSVSDDGKGISPENLERVTDPFFTTARNKKTGLGLPLFAMASSLAGGKMTVRSDVDDGQGKPHGTTVTATFDMKRIDCPPLGDIVSTVRTLVQGSPDKDFIFVHTMPDKIVRLDTAQIRKILGDRVSLAEYEVLEWITDSLKEQYLQSDDCT